MTSSLLFAVSTMTPHMLSENTSSFPGALSTRVITEWPEVHGQFDLWRGQWWRVLAGAFHHVNLLHLGGNAVTLWLLADLLEPRLGRIRFLIFSLAAAMFSGVAEVLIENDCVGLSGLVFAMFGLLLVLRPDDDELLARMPDGFIVWGFAWLFLCIPLTAFNIVTIANAAHCSGLVYGYAVGKVCYGGSPRRKWMAPFLLIVVNAVPLVLLVAAMHPVWLGRYFAWRGFQYDRPADWHRAVEVDPSIGVAWMRLMELDLEQGELHTAWQRGLTALRLNRSDDKLQERVVAVWSQFDSATARDRARRTVQQVFGDESAAWLARLRILNAPKSQFDSFEFFDLPPQRLAGLGQFINFPEQLAGVTQPFKRDQTPGDVDPDDPRSALLGDSL